MTSALNVFVENLQQRILPFWLANGFDDEIYMFAERLDLLGNPLPNVPMRAMVQARQIAVYGDAARRGLSLEGGEAAIKALENLLARYCDEGDVSRGFAFSIARRGEVVDPKRDAYTHAFVLFALAAAHRLTGEPRYLRIAAQTDAFIHAHLVDHVHLGLFTQAPTISQDKLQNPHMHLLEAYLALLETSRDEKYLERAAQIVELFDRRLYRHDIDVLPEYLARDWTEHPDPELGRFFEPGHHFEWAWLLCQFDRLAKTDNRRFVDGLWQTACRSGVDDAGLCYDAVDFEFKPFKSSTRLWPHTEAIKAAAVKLQDDPKARGVAETMACTLNTVFLGMPFAEGWIDQFDAQGRPRVDYVPASSLYHLYLASTEISGLDVGRSDPAEAGHASGLDTNGN